MSQPTPLKHFRTVLSIEPLLDFWRAKVSPKCPHMARMFASFENQILQIPELQGDITQPDAAAQHTEIIAPLMSVAFPSSTWETEITGAFAPFQSQTIYCSPGYRRLLLDENGNIPGRLKGAEDSFESHRIQRAYGLILDRVYGITQGLNSPAIRIVTDPQTGLERHFQINPDHQFVQVGTVGRKRELSDRETEHVIEHATDPEVLMKLLPPENFLFRGFTVVRAVEVTQSEITSELERDLIDQETIFSTDGIKRLQDRLRSLFGNTDLTAGLGAVQGDKILILNDSHTSKANCLFTNSSHIPIKDLENSIWLQAVDQERMVRISDLTQEPNRCPAEQDLVKHGIRSILVAPLFFGGKSIGTFWIKSTQRRAFNALDNEAMRHIAPLFSMALKRGLDDMSNEVQAIIKEKCTAVHPSVEWRFRKAAVGHMERQRQGVASEMDAIVFKGVTPMFGQSDIRGSSTARLESIRADLTEQLNLAGEVMHRAVDIRKWPLLDEFIFRIDRRIANIEAGLTAEEERQVASFLKSEVEPSFDELRSIGPSVNHAIDRYNQALDPEIGAVYRRRRQFEASVAMLNDRLSAYLDKKQTEAQKTFPHYFEKNQTDGVDYVIYLGASMHPQGQFNPFHLKNLALWQLEVACGLARHTHRIQPELTVPLNTCHLILVNHTPLSIRFRYDEKRFDVDGAYDVRHEIVKSRLDKARVKNGNERLTQPDRIAVVYSHPKEGREMRRHIEFLQHRGQLSDDLETIDLEDLPGVSGLKALRIGVNLEAGSVAQGLTQATG